ncbi:MAG TPA: TetR family transcriptional regulator [Lapillicoccus sp.]|nr:TetR family transcriptional regulator [Lapillicoccus sp.]
MPTSTPPAEPVLGLRERKKARTKAAIQEHALRLFREQGYAETTVEQIAAAAEVSPSTFFRYFPAKEDTVLTDLMDRRTFEVMIAAPAELSPLEALKYAVAEVFRDLTDEQLQLEMVRNDLIRSVPELRRGMVIELTRPRDLLAEAIARRLGRPLDDPDLRLYAAAIMGVLMTLALDEPSGNPEASIGRLGALIDRIDRVVHLPEV